MEKYKFPTSSFKIIETGLLAEDATVIVEELILDDDLPDAFMCINDLVALSVISILSEHSIAVPEDIGVIGFTETKMASLMSPKLSSVKQPTYEMGKTAAEMLCKSINNIVIERETVIMNGDLNIRKSSSRS